MAGFHSLLHVSPRVAAACMLLLSGGVGLTYGGKAVAAPGFTLWPAARDYGDQTLFTQRTQSLWLKNTGTVPLDLTSVSVGGANSALFTRIHNCGSSIALATSCRIDVTFRPTSVGAKSASLRVVASGLARTSNLTGTGVNAQFSLSPTALAFGNVPVGTTSAAQPVTVTNTGSGVLPIQSIKLGGTNPGQFAMSHNCPLNVAVNGNCRVQVSFKPSSTGSKSGTVVVTPSGGVTPKSVALGGQGTSASTGLPTDTSSTQSAYVLPRGSGWSVVPLLTVGDPSGSAYAMAGKADGLGAMAGRISDTGQILEAARYLTILMNHELPIGAGAVHSHGTRGAFVSQWTMDLNTLRVVAGRDLVARTFAFSGSAWSNVTGTLTFDRLCSADLPAASAFFNAQSGRGFNGRLFMNGEEAGTEGRAFAHVVTGAGYGNSYQLPYLGKFAHENVLVHPSSGDTTLAVSLDDTSPGQVYVYVGSKSTSGNPVVRAGLHGGRLYGIKVVDGGANYGGGVVPRENNGAINNGRFELVDVSAYALGSGANLQAASVALGVTDFARPEDGHWDTINTRSFYWATTGAPVDGVSQSARLYKLTFDSLAQPSGGTIELVVDSFNVTGSDGARARGFDNITVDGAGRVVVQEDAGDTDYITKTWLVDPTTGPPVQAVQILESDRNRFAPGVQPNVFLTRKEENSGVIEITNLVRNASWYEAGRRYYLGTNQAHYTLDPPLDATLFEGGQLYLFASPP